MNHEPPHTGPPTDQVASRLAADLAAAQVGRFTIASRRGTSEAVSLEAAYGLGQVLESERMAAGWRPIGWKLGFTNQALWSKLGLDRPIRARIYEQTRCSGELDIAELVQPRIEPEIVVGFGADVPRNATIDAIAEAIEWMAAGLEVVRCHFASWDMTPAEAVADGGVHAALAVGPPTLVDPEAARSVAAATCELFQDGRLAATGRGSNVLGGPLEALVWLLRELPGGVRTGEIVTTGTLTPAMPIERGQRWEHRLSAVITLDPVTLSLH